MADIFSATRLINRALLKVGGAESTQLVADITDETVDLNNKIRVVLPDCLDAVLEMIDWVEAKAYLSLGNAVDGVGDAQGDWQYTFHFPTDCVVVREQIDQKDRKTRYECDPFGEYFLTNTLSNTAGDSAYIRYTKRLQDEARMSQAMREAFVRKVAMELAGILKPEKYESLQKEFYEFMGSIAAQANGARTQPKSCDEKFTLLYPGTGINVPYPANGPWYWYWWPH